MLWDNSGVKGNQEDEGGGDFREQKVINTRRKDQKMKAKNWEVGGCWTWQTQINGIHGTKVLSYLNRPSMCSHPNSKYPYYPILLSWPRKKGVSAPSSSPPMFKIKVFNNLQMGFGPLKYTFLKRTLQKATPNWKWWRRHLKFLIEVAHHKNQQVHVGGGVTPP